MSGRTSRNKGRAFEQELVRWFKSYGIEARRGYQSRGGGAEQADVILPGLDYHIEAKRPAKCAAYMYVDQAMADSKASGLVPVVLLRSDRRETLAIMLADDWIKVLKDVKS